MSVAFGCDAGASAPAPDLCATISGCPLSSPTYDFPPASSAATPTDLPVRPLTLAVRFLPPVSCPPSPVLCPLPPVPCPFRPAVFPVGGAAGVSPNGSSDWSEDLDGLRLAIERREETVCVHRVKLDLQNVIRG